MFVEVTVQRQQIMLPVDEYRPLPFIRTRINIPVYSVPAVGMRWRIPLFSVRSAGTGSGMAPVNRQPPAVRAKMNRL
jgi:hypothetical protein